MKKKANFSSNLTIPAKKKAISYIRFSTAAQGDEGRDSTRRQTNALNAALTKWNLELDETFKDEGKSGYHQRHLAKGGAMHRLRELAISGKLRGFVCVVEDFDRAGRMQVTDAAPLLLDMLNNGVDLVVGEHGGEYFSKNIVNANPYLFYSALDKMNRGFEESKRKTESADSKWQARKEAVEKGEPIPLNSLPFWLENERNPNNPTKFTGKYLLRQGMKKLIQEVFKMYLAGDGSQVIANKLDERGIPLPPRRNGEPRKNANGWHSSFVQKIIKNRAVLGYYHDTDHKIFPVLIRETDFYRANKQRKERIRFSGRKAEHVNPYSNICYCAKCGGHMTRHSSRKNQDTVDKYVYLQCRNSRRKICSAAGMPYQRFENSFAGIFLSDEIIENIGDFEVLEDSKSDEIKNKIAHVEKQIAKFKATIAAMDDPDKAVSLGQLLTNCDKQHAQLTKDLEQAIIQEKGTIPLTKDYHDKIKAMFEKVRKLKEPDTRREIQEALRTAIDRITIDVKKKSYTVTWKNSPSVVEVKLVRGGYTKTIFNNQKTIITKGGPKPPKIKPAAKIQTR